MGLCELNVRLLFALKMGWFFAVERKSDDQKYLKIRGGWYYYYRHIPTRLQPFFSGKTIHVALKTRSAEIARMRRDGRQL